jgi:NAD-dependent DNA ligase
MRMLWESCLVGLVAVSGLQASEQMKITAGEAKTHVGETVTVCGKVVATRISKYKVADRGRPLILDLDQPEPHPVFLILTWPSDSAKPEQAKNTYQGKQVCVTGKIVEARGVPQIIAPEPPQIQVQSDKTK